jgi:hypothetical protein
MLTIQGHRYKLCDGIPRRSFLRIGALGLGGLAMPDLLRAEAQSGPGAARMSVINLHLPGGPSHVDIWDLKPEAPAEIRGEFRPIATTVAGMRICELLPLLAKRADRFALVRGVVGCVDEHTSSVPMTGYGRDSLKEVGGRPSMGAVLSKLTHSTEDRVFPDVTLMGDTRPTGGYLGPAYRPYAPDQGSRANLLLGRIDGNRMRNRLELLRELDTLRREVDASGMMKAMDAFTQSSVDLIGSGKMAEALSLKSEKPETLNRYLGPDTMHFAVNRSLLLARRLVEAGVRCVSVEGFGGWDTHTDNFNYLRNALPALDAGLSALLDDLKDRGMLGEVMVVAWGEFGRSPRIGDKAGRDHWSRLSAAFVAGGGMKMGQVIGSSDRHAADALDPIHVQQIHATLYRKLGIDPETTQFVDPAGRPQYLLDVREPIRQLL